MSETKSEATSSSSSDPIHLTEYNDMIQINGAGEFKTIQIDINENHDATFIKSHWNNENIIRMNPKGNSLSSNHIQLRIDVAKTAGHIPNQGKIDLMIHTILLTTLRMALITTIAQDNRFDNNVLEELDMSPLKRAKITSARFGNTVITDIRQNLKTIEDEFVTYIDKIVLYLRHINYNRPVKWKRIYENFKKDLQDSKNDESIRWHTWFFINEIQDMVSISCTLYSFGLTSRVTRNLQLCYQIIYATALYFEQPIHQETVEDNYEEDNSLVRMLAEVVDEDPIDRPIKKPKLSASPSAKLRL